MSRPTLYLLALLALTLAACSSATPAPPPTPTPTAQAWLDRAVTAWGETESFHFELALDGRMISLDESGTLSFGQAEGDVIAPDRLRAQTLVRTPLGSIQVAMVAIGEAQWLTNPLSGEWEVTPPSMQADVGAIFDREAGIGAWLAEMDNLERLADETVAGEATPHLRGTLPGRVMIDFAPDLAEQEQVTVDLWISQASGRLQKVLVTEPESGATWTFTFSQYGAVPAIEPPL